MSSTSPTPARHAGLLLHPLAGLALGVIAGLAIWGLVQGVHPVFQMPRNLHLSMGSPAPLVEAHRAEQRQIDRKHAMLYVGCLGVLLGAALGCGEAWARRSLLPPLLAVPLGAAGGVAGGLLASLVQEYVRANVGMAEIQHTVGLQLALCVPLAAGVALALGLATRTIAGTGKALLAGLAGGALAAVIYPLVTSTLFPAVSTDSLLPETATSRLFWLVLMAGLIGLAIPIAGRRRKAAATATTTPTS